jgi:hypothetical protein
MPDLMIVFSILMAHQKTTNQMKLLFSVSLLSFSFFTFAQGINPNSSDSESSGIQISDADFELYSNEFSAAQQKYSRARIFYSQAKDLFLLAKNGVVIDHGKHKQGVFIESDFSENELKVAKGLGLNVSILIEDVKKYYVEQNMNAEIKTL